MLILLVMYPCRNACNQVQKIYGKVCGLIFWGFWIRFLLEDSLVATISVFCDRWRANKSVQTELETLDDVPEIEEDTSPADVDIVFYIINISLAIFLAAALVGLPLYILSFYQVNFSKLKDEQFKNRYGEAYAGMDPEKKASIYFNAFFLLRRYIFALTICTQFVLGQVWL